MADAQSATAAVGSEADCSGDEPIFCETDDELLEGCMIEEAPSLSASMPHAHQTAGNTDGAGGAIAVSDSNTGKRKRGKRKRGSRKRGSDAEGVMKCEREGQARAVAKSPITEGSAGAEDSDDCGWSAISTTEDSDDDDEGWNAIASKQRQMMKQRQQRSHPIIWIPFCSSSRKPAQLLTISR